MIKIGIIALLFSISLNGITAFAQTDRGAGNIRVKTDNGQTKEIKIYDGSYALVIGESDYANGWDKLPGVKTDVAEVRSSLERQGFKVETEINLTSDNFKSRVDRFIGDYGYGANNRLLIYFAGHGHTQKSNDGRDLGYIIPVDAPLPEKDDIGFRRKAVSMDAIQAFARQIEAKHALFIFDSCFSGKLISRDKITIPPVIQENVAYAVRQFITAGAANQSVPDESIFRKAFVRGIDGEADRNGDGYITGSELADYLKEKVTNASDRTQTPQYGKIRDIDLDRGDFVFVSPKGAVINNASIINSKSANDDEDASVKIEDQFWETIKNSGAAEDFKFYKEKYPSGKYINLADLKIMQISRTSQNNSGANSQTSPSSSAEKSYAQQEYEKQLVAIQAKNREIEKSNEIAAKSLNEGVTAYNQKNYDLAIQKFNEGINTAPDWAGSAVVLNNNKASALKMRGFGFYERSVSDAANRSSLLQRAKNDFYDSVAAYRRSLSLISSIIDQTEASKYLISKYTALSEIAENYRLLIATKSDLTPIKEAVNALTEYEAVETDAVKKSRKQVFLADAFRIAGHCAEAIPLHRKALSADSGNIDAAAGLGICLVSEGIDNGNRSQKQEGKNYLQKFLDVAPVNHKLRASAAELINYLKTEEK